jgi:hypothetical protein
MERCHWIRAARQNPTPTIAVEVAGEADVDAVGQAHFVVVCHHQVLVEEISGAIFTFGGFDVARALGPVAVARSASRMASNTRFSTFLSPTIATPLFFMVSR